MARWIDADDLISRIRATISINTNIGKEYDNLKTGLMLCEKLVEKKCPSIDIVRCGECTWFDTDNTGEPYCMFSKGLGEASADDFCSHGERRE